MSQAAEISITNMLIGFCRRKGGFFQTYTDKQPDQPVSFRFLDIKTFILNEFHNLRVTKDEII